MLINLNDIFPSCFLDAIECTADDLIRDSPRFQNQAISVNWLGLKTLLHILKSTRKCARVFVTRTSEKYKVLRKSFPAKCQLMDKCVVGFNLAYFFPSVLPSDILCTRQPYKSGLNDAQQLSRFRSTWSKKSFNTKLKCIRLHLNL